MLKLMILGFSLFSYSQEKAVVYVETEKHLRESVVCEINEFELAPYLKKITPTHDSKLAYGKALLQYSDDLIFSKNGAGVQKTYCVLDELAASLELNAGVNDQQFFNSYTNFIKKMWLDSHRPVNEYPKLTFSFRKLLPLLKLKPSLLYSFPLNIRIDLINTLGAFEDPGTEYVEVLIKSILVEQKNPSENVLETLKNYFEKNNHKYSQLFLPRLLRGEFSYLDKNQIKLIWLPQNVKAREKSIYLILDYLDKALDNDEFKCSLVKEIYNHYDGVNFQKHLSRLAQSSNSCISKHFQRLHEVRIDYDQGCLKIAEKDFSPLDSKDRLALPEELTKKWTECRQTCDIDNDCQGIELGCMNQVPVNKKFLKDQNIIQLNKIKACENVKFDIKINSSCVEKKCVTVKPICDEQVIIRKLVEVISKRNGFNCKKDEDCKPLFRIGHSPLYFTRANSSEEDLPSHLSFFMPNTSDESQIWSSYYKACKHGYSKDTGFMERGCLYPDHGKCIKNKCEVGDKIGR